MSYDQRPGKLRVVSDSAGQQRRTGDPVTIDGKAVKVAPQTAGALANSAGGKKGLPLLSAALFLLACAAGGVAVALVRPFGLG